MTDIEQVVHPAANPTRAEYFTHFLAELLGDTSPEADLVTAWVTMATLEDNHAEWNPSSLTQIESGATEYNSFGPGNRYHVYSYASAEQALSAWLRTWGGPEMAILLATTKRVQAAHGSPISEGHTNLEVYLAAIATSPWTGIVGDPGLYDGVEPVNSEVPGSGGWPEGWTPAPKSDPQPEEPAAPAPAEAPETAPESEAVAVGDAIAAQDTALVTDIRDKKIADGLAMLDKLAVHESELKDLLVQLHDALTQEEAPK